MSVNKVVQCIPYKEPKEEPKTKRVAVIWFGDVPTWWDDMRIRQTEISFKGKNDESDFKEWSYSVEPIDPARLRYGEPKKGDLSLVNLNKPLFNPGLYVQDFDWGPENREQPIRLIIDPPKQQETLEEWLDRMPKVSDDRDRYLKGDDNATMSKYIAKIEQWQSERPAQERHEDDNR